VTATEFHASNSTIFVALQYLDNTLLLLTHLLLPRHPPSTPFKLISYPPQLTHLSSPLLSSPLLSAGFLGPDEEYVLVPTTFADGKLGSFVVSVTSATEFSFVVEKKQN
jgi:hypothetical protein